MRVEHNRYCKSERLIFEEKMTGGWKKEDAVERRKFIKFEKRKWKEEKKRMKGIVGFNRTLKESYKM